MHRPTRASQWSRLLPFIRGSQWLAAFTLAVGAAACATLSLSEHFLSAPGPVTPVATSAWVDAGEVVDASAESEAIPVYKDAAPPGFSRVAGQARVQVGYGHHIIGTVEYQLDDGRCDPSASGVLAEDTIFARLRDRAESEGGNAVIYAEVFGPQDLPTDCARLQEYRERGHPRGPWARGVIVWLATPEDGDGGTADEDRHAAARQRRLRKEDELPPPIDTLPPTATTVSP